MARRKRKKIHHFAHKHSNSERCPICCIIPPYMLEQMAVNGTETQREWAFETLNLSAQIRGRRINLGNMQATPEADGKNRIIYDAKNFQQLPGEIVRREGEPATEDAAVNEAYDAAGATYDFFKQICDRDSIDDKNLRLDSTVHYGQDYENAFWNGSQMVYGDGDGELFNRFTKSVDVIGHELTHGVTQYEADLIYSGEAGALNESFSDVFGSLVKQHINNQTAAQADWLIGAELFTENVKGEAIRSMKAPGTAYNDPVLGEDPQPAHMDDLYTGTKDNGGVHINSGIPNYAFYLAAMEIGGYAWEKAGKIWYISLCEELDAKANFQRAAEVTITVAGELYGKASNEQKAVENAWKQVGIN